MLLLLLLLLICLLQLPRGPSLQPPLCYCAKPRLIPRLLLLWLPRAVAGPARSGKSTASNILAGATGSEEIFASSAQGTSFTKGIHVGNRFLNLTKFRSALR